MAFIVGILCLTLAFLLQGTFVWLASKVARLDCSFKEAIIIAAICTLLLLIPKIGLLLSLIMFFVLLIKWLGANATEAVLVSLVFFILNLLMMFTRIA